METFSCAQIDLRKARERELATLDEKSTSSGCAEPCARSKSKARTGGGGGGRDDTCDHGLSTSWKVDVCEKRKIYLAPKNNLSEPKAQPDNQAHDLRGTKQEAKKACNSDEFGLTPSLPETFFGGNFILQVSTCIGRDFGARKGLRTPVIRKTQWPKSGIPYIVARVSTIIPVLSVTRSAEEGEKSAAAAF